MDKNAIIVVTGAAGFIGSCLVGYLNQKGYEQIIIADAFENNYKRNNYQDKKVLTRVHRNDLPDWLSQQNIKPALIFHLGARTDTTEFDYSVLEKLNVDYSKRIWNYCMEKNIPLIYASSAATYGNGELGYRDDHSIVEQLQPLNPYGQSKNEFDKWVLRQPPDRQPPFWYGLKFFNVYGPNEYHKGRMASVIFHAFNQIMQSGNVKLFKSHKPQYPDGGQLRDFIYVMDVLHICYWLMERLQQGLAPTSGLYNVGTGKARTFNDLAAALFKSLDKKPQIEYINTPEDIRHKYQYFTEADMHKLQEAGYKNAFYSLEEGVNNYVKNFLIPGKYY